MFGVVFPLTKLDLYVLDGNLTGQKYRDNVLAPCVVHFDDNARPHRGRIVQHFLQQEAVQTIPWPAMSPDMNTIEHVWDFIVVIIVKCMQFIVLFLQYELYQSSLYNYGSHLRLILRFVIPREVILPRACPVVIDTVLLIYL